MNTPKGSVQRPAFSQRPCPGPLSPAIGDMLLPPPGQDHSNHFGGSRCTLTWKSDRPPYQITHITDLSTVSAFALSNHGISSNWMAHHLFRIYVPIKLIIFLQRPLSLPFFSLPRLKTERHLLTPFTLFIYLVIDEFLLKLLL